MQTLMQLKTSMATVPTAAAWYLADLGEAKGKQELYTRQSPQALKALREHAMIESAISSNRIEGVEIDAKRVREVILGNRTLKDRNEEEVQGYRDALNLIHHRGRTLPLTEKTIRELHRVSRGEIWDAGQYKKRDIDIIESLHSGGYRVRFKSVPANQTAAAMKELVSCEHNNARDRSLHPLISLAAFNLDFLCIHPFRDGNGRVSRLLLLLQSYQAGLEVGRYISFERIIEQNKDRYYETLEQSSQRWHQGTHNPWPYIHYVLFILKSAYSEFEGRFGQVKPPRGEKKETVANAIRSQTSEFTLADLQRICPGVGVDYIRLLLKQLRMKGEVKCVKMGRNAVWKRLKPRTR